MVKQVLNKCCCFPLETGVVIIGVLHLLSTCSSLVSACMGNTPIVGQVDKDNSVLTPEQENYYRVTSIVSCVIQLITIALLFFGIFKKNPVFHLPYLIITMLNLIVIEIFILIIFIVLIVAGQGLTAFIFFIICSIIAAIGVYTWLVVHSHYALLKSQNERRGYNKPYQQP